MQLLEAEPARECYLISATGLVLINGILLGFRVAKELRAHKNYGTGVVPYRCAASQAV